MTKHVFDKAEIEAAMEIMKGDDWAVAMTYVNRFNPKDVDVYVVKSKLTFQEARRIVAMIDDGDIVPHSRTVMINLITEMDGLSPENARKVFDNTYIGRASIIEIDK